MPNPYTFIPGALPQGQASTIYGEVGAPAPTSFDDPLTIMSPDWSTTIPLVQVDQWPADHGSALPAVGDTVLLEQDSRGYWRVASWRHATATWGGVTLPASKPAGANETILSNGSGGTFWGTISASGGGTVSCRGYRTGALSIPASTDVSVLPDNISWDSSGMLNTSTGHITAQLAGYYQVDYAISLLCPSGLNDVWMLLHVNGATVSEGQRYNLADINGAINAVGSDVVYLNAGDYVTIGVFTESGASLYTGGSAMNFVSVFLISSLPGTTGTTTVARAYLNQAWTIPATNVWEVVPLNATSFDPAGLFNTSTNRYIVPATGYYQVNGILDVNPGTSYSDVSVYIGLIKNGTVLAQNGATVTNNGGGVEIAVSDLVQCNAGDYLQLGVFSNGAWAAGVSSNGTALSVVQVGTSMNFTAAGGTLKGTYPNPTKNGGYFTYNGGDSITAGTWNFLAHAERVNGVVVPANSIVYLTYRAHFDKTVGSGAVYAMITCAPTGTMTANSYAPSPFGNGNGGNPAYLETPGMTNGAVPTISGVVTTNGTSLSLYGTSGSVDPSDLFLTGPQGVGSPIALAMPAGTYDFGISWNADPGVAASRADPLLVVDVSSF